jgi:Sigma-70, region 4
LSKALGRAKFWGAIATGLGLLALLAAQSLPASAQVQVPSAPSLPAPVPNPPPVSVPAPAPSPPAVPLPKPPAVSAPAPVPSPPAVSPPKPPVSVPSPPSVRAPSPPAIALPGGSSGSGAGIGGTLGAVGGSGAGRGVGGSGNAVGGLGGSGSVGGDSAGGSAGGGSAGGGWLGGLAGGGSAGGGERGGGAASVLAALGYADGDGAGAAARRASAGRGQRAPSARLGRSRRSRALANRRERLRRRVVRRLSGCLDGLPALQRSTLILRFGVGPVSPRSRGEAARVLELSSGRVRRLEVVGMRSLVERGLNASCEGSGVTSATLVAVYALLADTSFADRFEPLGPYTPPVEAGIRLASAAGAEVQGEGAVAGVTQTDGRQASDEEEVDEDDVSSAGPALGGPFASLEPSSENPIFLVLLAIAVACLGSALREIVRAVR